MNKKRIIRNYIYNLLYQALLLVTPLITTPYISRVLGATNLGIHGYVSSIASYFVLFGAIGTSLYGSREIAYYQDDPIARTRVFYEILLIRITFSLIASALYIVLFCFSDKYTIIYRIFTIEVISNALDISWFFQGVQDFKKTVLRNVIVKILGIVLIFLFVKDETYLPFYSVCTTLPLLVGHLTLWPYLKNYIVSSQRDKIDVKRHFKPIFALFVPQIAVDVYTILDKTMIGALSTEIAEVGYYTQTQKIIKLALKIVTSIGVVMLPAMALEYKKGNQENLRKAILNSFRFMSYVGIPIMFGIIGISDDFVPWFFGKGYETVKSLLKLTAPLIVIIGYSTVVGSQYLLATKKQSIYTGSVICGSVINIIGNFILIPKYNALGATIASVLAEFSVSAIQVFFTRNDIPMIKYTAWNLQKYLAGAFMLGVILLIGNWLPSTISTTIVQIIVGVGVYFVLTFIFKCEEPRMVIQTVKRKLQSRKDKGAVGEKHV